MTATVNELHNDTAKLLKPVIENGQTLVIVNDGVPCAKIVPVSEQSANGIKARVVVQNGISYLHRGKPITNEEVAELLTDFP